MVKSVRTFLLFILSTLSIGVLPAYSLEITTDLLFTTSGSLWDEGSSGANISTEGSKDINLFISTVDVSYNIGVSSGTVDVIYQGDILVDYEPTLLAPGTTTVSLDFLGDSGRLETDLGFWANIDLENTNLLDGGRSLNIDTNFVPEINDQVTAADSQTVGSTQIPLGVAEAGAYVEIEQASTFEASAIDGWLAYSLSGSSALNTMPFSLDTETGKTFDLDLFQEGTWDFWFVDMALENLFSTAFDVEMVLYEVHTVVTWDTSCSDECSGWNIFGVCLSWDEVCVDHPTTTTVRNDFTLLELDLYDGDPFALDFSSISTQPLFSIDVESAPVPEPSTILLLGSGLFSLAWYGRRRKKT